MPSSKQLPCIKTAIKGHLDGYQSANGLQLNGVKLAVAPNLFVTNTITNCDKNSKNSKSVIVCCKSVPI